jgi:hypothetical protein
VNQNEIAKLEHIVQRFAALNDEIKAAQDEQKELGQAAFDDRLIHVAAVQDARKVLKRLAKERDWDEIKRMAQAQLEQALDECRAALGLLADTPLGQAAQQRPEPADHQGEKRGRGRPKGSRNKPKLATSNGQAMPPPPPLPPDVPDADAA